MAEQAQYGLLLAVGLLGGSCVQAADDTDVPDIEFLEYLGSWDESDEDWLIVSAAEKLDQEHADKRKDAAPDGESSTEHDDER